MRRHPTDPSRPRARRPEPLDPEGSAPESALPSPIPVPRPRSSWSRTPLETVLLASTAALLAAVAWPIASGGSDPAPPSPVASTAQDPAPTPAATAPATTPDTAPVIQIALLLDTSSSMGGLIDQARSQLWSVVNALDSATLHGERPTIEIALYEYGNSDLHLDDGFIRQVSAFTPELDRVAEALFTLDTVGGSEHAGQVIARSLDELAWKDGGLRVIYIAGNEELEQGPVPWQVAIERARARGIVVNTVNCTQGHADPGWQPAAALAGGRFLQIDHNAVAEHIAAPQDERIARLGEELNRTYVGYGRDGKWGLRNQVAQDSNSARFGSASSIQRAITKSSASYRNPSWDLLDALETETVTMADVDRESLPQEAREMNEQQLDDWVAEKKRARDELKRELGRLATEREAYVASVRAELGQGAERLDTAMVRSIVEQARAVGFTIEPTA